MDRYFTSISKKPSLQATKHRGKTGSPRYRPYENAICSGQASSSQQEERGLEEAQRSAYENIEKDGSASCITRLSSEDATKVLLNTLSAETNPITHSDISQRSDRVVSTASGHQVSDEKISRRLYMDLRERKLAVQREKSPNAARKSMQGVRVYIDGYLAGSTDIEMKRIIIEAGGQIVHIAAQCTHILTSQWLSGTKTHKLLTSRLRNRVFVVKPEWVTDSIAAGKRRPEREYSVVNSGHTLHDMLKK